MINLIKLNKRLNKFTYGKIINNKVFEDDDSNTWFNDYKTIPIGKFEKYKAGVCWDYVNYQSDWLSKHNYEYKNIFIMINNDKDDPTHTFTLVLYKDKIYWIESSWKVYKGIHEFDSVNEAIINVCKKFYNFCHDHGTVTIKDKFIIREYNTKKLDKNVSPEDFMNIVINNGKPILINIRDRKL